MKKKLLLFIISFFLISQCGFTPMHSGNSIVNKNIYIKSIEFEGDQEINKYLKIYLSGYNKTEKTNGFSLKINSSYKKETLSKDKSAKITNYRLSSIILVEILLKDKLIKKISIKEQNNMENMSDKFEEQKYENDVKQNFASSTLNKLILELTLLNDN